MLTDTTYTVAHGRDMRKHMHAHAFRYTYIRIQIHTHAHKHMRALINIYMKTSMNRRIHIDKHIYICPFAHVYIQKRSCTDVNIQTSTNTLKGRFIYVHTHVHTF